MILALTPVSPSSMIANTQRENDQNTTSCLGRKHVESRSFPFTCSLYFSLLSGCISSSTAPLMQCRNQLQVTQEV
ncbi:hypothetical protein HBH98_042650 [Parastagonospora nodorum]|nr:hypothetical protein HBH51_081850 [Parastagonospora nodorum]KAH4054973.1 hypothetical protein HBH49_069760 [Parastagonospora nodorum]KAH4131404.1 hypothetical protein HBH47_018040 [Parastagonospora nodorum]KAH4195004.1 hypothetical protein HBH42_087770 [Parastagonospora nodorum]KAH4232029.1 hypothetical protein HBI06_077080 [Parastagonospora nodorum]